MTGVAGNNADHVRAERSGGLYGLRFGGRVDPLGRPQGAARLAWSVAPDADLDLARGFRVAAARDAESLDEPEWSITATRTWTTYDGSLDQSRSQGFWKVMAVTRGGEPTHSHIARWEVGLTRPEDWAADWISAPEPAFRRESWDPCPYVRREFELESSGAAARLYISALGLYRVWLNGIELSADALLRPGWTDYDVRVYHQTFDCTRAVRTGRNVLAVKLANGWYAGRLGLLREPGLWGSRPAVIAQLEQDGTVVVGTDENWRAGFGSEQASDMLRGESQDLRQDPSGWLDTGFDDHAWQPAEPIARPAAPLEPQPHNGIAHHRTHRGTLVHEHARGPAVFDFGQNLVGWTRLTTRCLPSVELIVRHGEILTPEKGVYRDNLRGAFQEDRYVVPDEGPHTLEPSFTLHGFRYAEVWGLPSREPYGALQVLPDTSIEALSVSALGETTGTFECSDADLNRLASNIEWTVRDNFLEVVTDCPQRDERHGWLGDAGVIAPTAAYLFDVSAFLAKFVQDIADAQGPDGEIRNYAPAVPPANLRPGAPGWSDGYIRLVHLLAERYGDLVAAERHFESMLRFLDHVDRANPTGLRVNAVGADFGDWLSLPEREGHDFHTGYAYTGAYSTTPHAIVDTAHSYRSFVQLAEIAAWLDRDGDAERLSARAEEIRLAYCEQFVLPDGTIKEATQTAYAQAVGFGLVVDDLAHAAAKHLRTLIEQVGYVTTGIHGVQHVLPVLAAHGHRDFAASLLLRDQMPSWLYMVAQGATTVWEKWDGIRPDGGLSTAEMNSFNHCALGAVGRFLYEGIAGLDATRTAWTGEVVVDPQYATGLGWVHASYASPSGVIVSSWRRTGDVIEHTLEVPGAATAVFNPPPRSTVLLGDRAATSQEPLRIGAGRHTLSVQMLDPT